MKITRPWIKSLKYGKEKKLLSQNSTTVKICFKKEGEIKASWVKKSKQNQKIIATKNCQQICTSRKAVLQAERK